MENYSYNAIETRLLRSKIDSYKKLMYWKIKIGKNPLSSTKISNWSYKIVNNPLNNSIMIGICLKNKVRD